MRSLPLLLYEFFSWKLEMKVSRYHEVLPCKQGLIEMKYKATSSGASRHLPLKGKAFGYPAAQPLPSP